MGLGLRRRLRRLRQEWYRLRLKRLEARGLCMLSVGEGVSLEVPVRVGGAGQLAIGEGTSFGFGPAMRLGSGEILLQPRSSEAVIRIGRNNAFSNNVCVIANHQVVIGDGCQIGDMVCIYDSDFHELDPITRNRSAGASKPVTIGNNVWLGSRVMVLKGVTIGDNSVVAAMSVVTRDIPANCVAAGMPAKVIRRLGQVEVAIPQEVNQ